MDTENSYVIDHAKAIDIVFHQGDIGQTYNIDAMVFKLKLMSCPYYRHITIGK